MQERREEKAMAKSPARFHQKLKANVQLAHATEPGTSRVRQRTQRRLFTSWCSFPCWSTITAVTRPPGFRFLMALAFAGEFYQQMEIYSFLMMSILQFGRLRPSVSFHACGGSHISCCLRLQLLRVKIFACNSTDRECWLVLPGMGSWVRIWKRPGFI